MIPNSFNSVASFSEGNMNIKDIKDDEILNSHKSLNF